MQHDHDDLERRVADAGLPGLAATSALLRRLAGTTVNASGTATGGTSAKTAAGDASRVQSRMFLYTGSQR